MGKLERKENFLKTVLLHARLSKLVLKNMLVLLFHRRKWIKLSIIRRATMTTVRTQMRY